MPAARLGRLKAPAGLDIGALSPEEIAVSIPAEIVQHQRGDKRAQADGVVAGAPAAPAQARDPVCGMSVDIAAARHRSEMGDRVVYFCCGGCKDAFDRDPGRYPVAG